MEIPELWTQVQDILEKNPEGLTVSGIARLLPEPINQMFLAGHLRTMAYLGHIKMFKPSMYQHIFKKVDK